MIYRYSSRRQRLDVHFLNKKLEGAKSYDRIAGYFSSSILEVAGEAIEKVEGPVRIVCNSEMEKKDALTISAALNSLRREWCSKKPEEIYKESGRLIKLYELIKAGKLLIKVLPNDLFGLIHGKAGVITLKDGKKTAFIGSVNESYSGWKLNYEILWEDDSEEAVNWVQEEFDYFWNHSYAFNLPDFVIDDLKRIANRKIITTIDEWRKKPEPAATVIETPVYREELGLWEHQKYFVKLAFEDHKKPYGARYVLADMVGLGKTIQLALAAELMALYGDKPVLVIVPKTLMWQWQDELKSLLDLPTAVWTGKEWVDENGISYPANDDFAITKCPRRIGIISQGLITRNSPQVQYLLNLEYECVIVDEAHRARRKNLGLGREDEKPEPNNLLKFLLDISKRTKSMLLATATPVQLYPIEAWDLLNVLAQANDSVLGSKYSYWRRYPGRAIRLITGQEKLEGSLYEKWEWLRDPFPPAEEDEKIFGRIREELGLKEDEFVVKPEALDMLDEPVKKRLNFIFEDNFIVKYNPFIRHIVRRTREFLENTINPETGEPYLKGVKVKLFGESDEEAIVLPPYLQQAYEYATEFCDLLAKRLYQRGGGGFLKTLLLRRVGSTIIAGKLTAEKMLANRTEYLEDLAAEEDDDVDIPVQEDAMRILTSEERECLEKFLKTLELNKENDPKFNLVLKLLIDEGWLERGCIIFSQYFDSVYWVAENLSKRLAFEKIGVYAGGDKSGVFLNGIFDRKSKEEIKRMVKNREVRLLIGTDAASEGLNLQTLGSLINLDLPWNPTRLEQRKGRIQRIGQIYDEVYIYNMRYKGSVEDRVHQLLSERFANIYGMFGQLPDVLEDVWVNVALNNLEEAKRKINEIPQKHPFELRYDRIEKVDWESCSEVLNNLERKKHLVKGWR
ncbi:helicase SNF2 [Carboxydothermus islandicus]|uniref:Helicase SNF2 n=1 Tax=Carboxydothermus islandicus TaxID=661089 RepID=A0A1L8D0W7_9THEO|nr:phospholipase D-like domain-containing anti-phage protein [Carboxydothermus islandicus]GAV24835.1 helicase SNF2 [Carboxydothermus islandicus]